MIVTKLKVILCLLFVAVLSAGCNTTPNYSYFTLKALAEPVNNSATAKPAHLTVGIIPVKVPEWLDNKKITYSDGGYRILQTGHQRWGEPLPQLLTRTLAANLMQLQPGLTVLSGPWDVSRRPQERIRVEVLELSVSAKKLVLVTRWQVESDHHQDQLVKVSRLELVLVDRESETVARGVSDLLTRLAADIYQTL
ncbi:PqiC family protein [Spongorhabdus nitratireducens]